MTVYPVSASKRCKDYKIIKPNEFLSARLPAGYGHVLRKYAHDQARSVA